MKEVHELFLLLPPVTESWKDGQAEFGSSVADMLPVTVVHHCESLYCIAVICETNEDISVIGGTFVYKHNPCMHHALSTWQWNWTHVRIGTSTDCLCTSGISNHRWSHCTKCFDSKGLHHQDVIHWHWWLWIRDGKLLLFICLGVRYCGKRQFWMTWTVSVCQTTVNSIQMSA
jgi:hypothetical protein